MTDLTHLWKPGQACIAILDGVKHPGTVKEVFPDHVIVDLPRISDHVWFMTDCNLEDLYPAYNFTA